MAREGEAGTEREYWPERQISNSNASRVLAAIPYLYRDEQFDDRAPIPSPPSAPRAAQRPMPLPAPEPPDNRGQQVQHDPPQGGNLGQRILQGYPADWVQPTGEGGGGGPPGSGMPITPSPSPTNPPLISGNQPPTPQAIETSNIPLLSGPQQALIAAGGGAAAAKMLGYGGPEQRRLGAPTTSAAPQITADPPPLAITHDPYGLNNTRPRPGDLSTYPTGPTTPKIDLPAVDPAVIDKALQSGNAPFALPAPDVLKPGAIKRGGGFLGELGNVARDFSKVKLRP